MIDSICIIVKRPPGEEKSTLGLRASYATLMSAIDTKLLFIEEGVYGLLKNTGYNAEMLRDFIKEDGEVYCTQGSLDDKGLGQDDIVSGVRIIPEKEVAEIIEESNSVAMF